MHPGATRSTASWSQSPMSTIRHRPTTLIHPPGALEALQKADLPGVPLVQVGESSVDRVATVLSLADRTQVLRERHGHVAVRRLTRLDGAMHLGSGLLLPRRQSGQVLLARSCLDASASGHLPAPR